MCVPVSQGGEEPDAGAQAAAGRGLPGVSEGRPGEGPQEERGAGAEEARGGEGPTDRPRRGEETKGEKASVLHLSLRPTRCRCANGRLLSFQNLEEEKERKSECLPQEPPVDDPDSVKIVFKLPNDTRVERRFLFGQSLTVSFMSVGQNHSIGCRRTSFLHA